jgi:hypothetical protein
MVYVVILTFSISQVIQAGLAIYLFLQLQRQQQLRIEEAYTIPSWYSPVMGSAPPLVGHTLPSAPLLDDTQTNK